ncbi:MAG: hypothetical protein IJT30_05015 [Muribaculaceae bacterium]|nr:hypothetical protein [Muribaculaceae bacterium]
MRLQFVLVFIMLAAVVLPAGAQRPANALTEEDYYYVNFADILASFDDLNSGVEKAYCYAIADLDRDGVKELVVADVHKINCVFKVVDGEVHLISPDYLVPVDQLNWNTVNDFYTCVEADRSQDVTLRHHPVFAYDINIARNQFTVPGDVAWTEAVMRSAGYNRMVFKPHVGNIHFVKAEPGTYEVECEPIDLGMCYTYALDDAATTKKMFRGYSNEQAVPIIVPMAWLDDHNPLQYSRWLSGEPERKGNADERKMIEEYYGGQDYIRDIRWLAGCELNERSFYEVLFQPRDGKVLLAMVCIAEGEVVSVRNMWFDQDQNSPNAIDFGPDIDDLMGLAPEIMVMAATSEGLELYVRWYSFEGVHYDIWREVADQFVTINGEYHYVMGY